MNRPIPSYPIWDSNTYTTHVDQSASVGAQVTTVTVPDNGYWVIFSAVDVDNRAIYIGDSTGTDATTGLYLEADVPGPANLSFACEAGTVFKVRHDPEGIFNYTFFLNVI